MNLSDAVGNDVVWLLDPAHRGRHADQRLTQRIFHSLERTNVLNSSDPDRTLWLHWAAKEAAFKAWMQVEPSTIFAPKRFEVSLDADGSGWVEHESRGLPLAWSADPEWVHVIVGDALDEVRYRVERRASELPESDAVRQLAVEFLQQQGVEPGIIEGRPPRYQIEGSDSGISLSLSHDGPFLAVAFRRLRTAG